MITNLLTINNNKIYTKTNLTGPRLTMFNLYFIRFEIHATQVYYNFFDTMHHSFYILESAATV